LEGALVCHPAEGQHVDTLGFISLQ